MNYEYYSDLPGQLNICDSVWEEKVERLKHDVGVSRIRPFLRSDAYKDAKSMDSGNKLDDPCYLRNVERVITDRHLAPGGTNAFRVIETKLATPTKTGRTESETVAEHATWVSPTNVMRKRPKGSTNYEVPFTSCDFPPSGSGQDPRSPKRIRSSPPKRNRNQEWSSPHRVVDRPKPQDSHGNWIPTREDRQTAPHFPAQGDADSNETPDEPNRPFSQSTYTVRRNIFPPEEEKPTVRKISVLDDFEPADSTPKKRGEAPPSLLRVVPSTDKVRRIVYPDGRVAKVSTLDDFSASALKNEEKRSEIADGSEKPDAAEAKPVKKTTLKKIVLSDIGRPNTGYVPRKTKIVRRTVEGKKTANSLSKAETKEEDQNNKENKPRNGELKDEEEKSKEEVDEVMIELKKILNDRKDGDDASAKRKSSAKKSGTEEEFAKKAKTAEEDKNAEITKRKRDLDLKAVQKYIKLQKVKRMEQLRIEREKKATEEEARKKKLEELRIRTMQLAATSKKKAPETIQGNTIKIIEPEAETEEDVTMSLGLKQTKPKVSYNESVSYLKKKPPALLKQEQRKQEPPPSEMEEKATEEEREPVIPLSPRVVETAKLDAPELDIENNTNSTLKKLAETLQMTMEQQKKALTITSPSKLFKDVATEVTEVRSNPKMITVDVETIKSLKQDIKKISQNFQVLQEIITDKSGGVPAPEELKTEAVRSSTCHLSSPSRIQIKRSSEGFPAWLKNITPRPHPYNVLTAVRNKMKLNRTSASSETSTVTGFSERNKTESDSESVPGSTNHLSSVTTDRNEVGSSTDVLTVKSSSDGNYYSLKEDSESELSSSILDSEKDRFFYQKEALIKPTNSLKVDNTLRDTPQSSNVESIRSISLDTVSVSSQKVTSSRESLVLVPPDVKLTKVLRTKPVEKSDAKPSPLQTNEVSASSVLSDTSLKTEPVSTEIEETGSESGKSLSENGNSKVKEVINRNCFNPEALHLQFQAELSLLETFQRSLAHFLEMERVKALSGTNVKKDKAVNTEEIIAEEEVAEEMVREEETDLVKTESDIIKTRECGTESETDENGRKSTATEFASEQKSTGEARASRKKTSDKLDLSDSAAGISFQMLNKMMKEEELRSEHQLALIRLREKTLNEKVKAELTLLELRKKTLKERGSSEELAISAIKKKQRGILLKYQSEREDIERLKKMHRIASEERRIMIKQQKQIRKMQLTTKDMLIKLKKREKSPQKKSPVKLKASKLYDSQSEIQEEISVNVSENTFTESITSVDESINRSIESDLDVTSKSNVSEGDDEILRRNMKTLEEKILKGVDKSVPQKTAFGTSEWKHAKRGHSAEDLMKWTRRLEEKENRLKEMEKEAENLFVGAKHRSMMSLMDAKISVRDRSTSPFQFQDAVKSICDSATEGTEGKKSSSVIELIRSNSKSREEEESKGNGSESGRKKLATSASEDIPEEFSKKTPATSRSIEYNSESFESSSDTHKSKAVAVREQNANNSAVMIKMALSPRVHSSRRRYSSGSDESINLFHTETASEQSDVEIRIAALQEQLHRRKLEAERLRREQKKAHKERLKAKEQSLLKQIEAYDTYIQKKKQELEQEYEKNKFAKLIIKREDEGNCPFQRKLKNGISESESEIAESIKTRTEEVSIKEEIVSDSKNKDSPCTTTSSMLESLPKQALPPDGSLSESEEQTISNASVKTTLLSPEKRDLEISAETGDIESSDQVEEGNYSQDSFESDEKSRSVGNEDRVEEERILTVEDGNGSNRSEEEDRKDGEEEETNEEGETEIEEAVSSGVADGSEIAETENIPEPRIVDFITESVLEDLMNESVTLMMRRLKKAEDRTIPDSDVDSLTNTIAGEIVSEVINDALRIYNKKKSIREKEKMQDVRRRVHEIMSQAPGTKREQRRPQEIMVTTYDVPLGTISNDEKEAELPEREEFLESLSPRNGTKQEKELGAEVTNLDANLQTSDVDVYGQEWFDDDFGLSRTRREAEELRVQQIQIEQEIQQLQAQQEQVVYYYLRQIPNKPPPPYTPPSTAAAERFTSEREITSVVSRVVRYLTDEMNNGKQVADINMPESFLNANDSEHVKYYKVFLYDLAKHIVSEILGIEVREEKLPWMRTNEKLSKFKVKKVDRTYECLLDLVMKEVLVMFGFKPKMGKERLIVRWSRKKRDHVDELLVGESQEEEAEWTHYEEDEVTVKNNVAVGILDSLLDETAHLLHSIWSKKTKKTAVDLV